ncbi:threonine synthase-like 1 [Mytilus galloprovincialis]|uniref:threonine synthase-like 1 n=1 Tax=Mytilus galloprovincialis TaxID=29158 RepID=UPI003F7C2252
MKFQKSLLNLLKCHKRLFRPAQNGISWCLSCKLPYRIFSTKSGGKQPNIILMGSPGSGKTTLGRILGERLGLPVADIDDHHLEPYWGKSVADKLSEVGPDRFVEEEGRALLHFDRNGHVVSLSGSNPMYSAAMNHISKTGIVVFLDTKHDDIVDRLEKMKVNRIVGQSPDVPMIDILKYRQSFYEKAYDIRVICEENETQDSIAGKIVAELKRYQNSSGYVSTRDLSKQTHEIKFSETILQGLAPDGGLFVPNNIIAKFSEKQLDRLVDLTYQDRALRILEKWIHPDDLHPTLLKQFINTAYSEGSFDSKEIFPIRHLEKNQYLLELFHGPTSSFKDAALQLLPQFFVHALQVLGRTSTRYLILVATSGDTGGAVLDGFSKYAGQSGVGVLVLFPENGISDVQKKQMTSMKSNNVHVVGVNGDFDNCQSYVKMAFQDPLLANMLLQENNCKLSAANSINWGRLLPQIVYHASAYLDLVKERVITIGDEIDVCIPTGNFGNILAAYYAKEMGIPIKRFICASNANNVLTEFINTGRYDIQRRRLVKTISPAIDILVSSNLERYLYHLSNENSYLVNSCFGSLNAQKCFEVPPDILKKMKSMFIADWCSEQKCHSTIKDTLQKTGYMLDPHTAVAKAVGDRFNNGKRPMIIASTAHCDKFAPEIMSFMGKAESKDDLASMFKTLQEIRSNPQPHHLLEKYMHHERVHNTVVNADYKEVVNQVISFSRNLRNL